MTPPHRLIVVTATTGVQKSEAYEIRRLVFSEEQGVPPELERDDEDENATHFLATLGESQIGAARTRPISKNRYKIERIAILKEYRSLGLGHKFVIRILEHLQQRGAVQVVIHAQSTTLPFYEALGFSAEGAVFEDAGISHRRMTADMENLGWQKFANQKRENQTPAEKKIATKSAPQH